MATSESARETFMAGLQQQQKAAAESRPNKDEWLARLSALFEAVRGWLQGADPEHLLKLETDEVAIIERSLGMYEAPCVVVRFPNGRTIRLEPRGLEVFGARGRVDVVSGPNRAMLVQTEPGEWVIAQRQPGARRQTPLSEETFLDLVVPA